MEYKHISEHICSASFTTRDGLREDYVAISGLRSTGRFADTLAALERCFEQALAAAELSTTDLVFSRLYLSDIENQKRAVSSSTLYRHLLSGVCSLVEQPPLGGSAASLLLYFVKGISKGPLRSAAGEASADPFSNSKLFSGKNYGMYWWANCTGGAEGSSADQTGRMFSTLKEAFSLNNLSLKRDLLRTWIYVRDVDNRYGGMVDARRAFFEQNGLLSDARYPASTGIEGRSPDTRCFVDMDVLAFDGVKDEQVEKMEALDFLSPTIDYGVTFERGIRIRFGDRSHFHISGTASIDKYGEIVHPEDVLKQTERTVVNMNALLESCGASIHQMAYILVYLRDPSDFEAVSARLGQLIPQDIPLIPLVAPVCRPGWLIEMEGTATAIDHTSFPPFL